jgi:hypothetical protein
MNRTSQRQQSINRYFDENTTVKKFQKGELVLLWKKAKEKPSMLTKFEALWIGPYIIEKIMGLNSYMLKYMKSKMLMLHVNGQHFKGFFTWNFLISLYMFFFYLDCIFLPLTP